jgi:hypothetical protein
MIGETAEKIINDIDEIISRISSIYEILAEKQLMEDLSKFVAVKEAEAISDPWYTDCDDSKQL